MAATAPFPPFVVADADGFGNRADKDLAVADTPGAGSGDDGLNGLFLHIVGDNEFDFDLGEKVNRVFAAAVKLGVALLAAVAAGFEYGHAFNACLKQGILDCIQLRRLENRFNFEHMQNASLESVTGGAAGWASPRPNLC